VSRKRGKKPKAAVEAIPDDILAEGSGSVRSATAAQADAIATVEDVVTTADIATTDDVVTADDVVATAVEPASAGGEPKPRPIRTAEETLQQAEDVAAQFNLANALASAGRLPEAIPHYEATVKLQPNFAEAYFHLGNALANTGRASEAVRAFTAALRLRPDSLEARYNLGCVLATIPGRANEARAELETVLRLKPDFAPAAEMLKRL